MNSTFVTGERHIWAIRAAGLRSYAGIVGMAVFVGGFLFLALLASEQAYTTFDLKIALWVQGVEFTGLAWLVGVANFLADGPGVFLRQELEGHVAA